jgi:hypothetical protein
MSSGGSQGPTPPSTPGKRSYNPLFLKAKVLIEASKAGDLQTIEELCKNEVRLLLPLFLLRAHFR